MTPDLSPFQLLRERTGIFLDFDGTLSEIVARPELARPLLDAPPLLSRLSRSFALVAVVSGRQGQDIRRLLGLSGVAVFGMYGLEGHPANVSAVRTAAEEVFAVSARVRGAWLEDKGASLAVHFRSAPDPDVAGRSIRRELTRIAMRHGLLVLAGKMVVELAPPETPGKGAVVLRESRARGLAGCVYAGDDRADLAAFAALDELRSEGVETLKVAVRSAETPRELVDAANAVVHGPSGLVELLERLTLDSSPGPGLGAELEPTGPTGSFARHAEVPWPGETARPDPSPDRS